MQAQDRHVLVTVATVLASVVLFAVPLILRYRVFKSVTLHVATSDIFPLRHGISTTWCQGQTIKSNVSFNAYLYLDEPEIVKNVRRQSQTVQHLRISNGVKEYWGFYLLEGSTFRLSLCARSPGAVLSVVRGHRELRRCLRDYQNYLEVREESDESEESGPETGPISSSLSSSEGVVSNETLESMRCKRAILYTTIQWDYRCPAKFRSLNTKTTVAYNVTHSDHYYFMFASETYLDLLANDIEAQFSFWRSGYDYLESFKNCTNVTSCDLPLSFLSKDTIVVDVLGSSNGTWLSDTLVTECVPRKGLYFLFFVALAIMILICAFQ